MNRLERLLAIVLRLQDRRVTTAARLAAEFELSTRTLYRDVAALGAAGVPIVAEAGAGYRLASGWRLAPSAFTGAEAAALWAAARAGATSLDSEARRALNTALDKVRATLDPELRGRMQALDESLCAPADAVGAGMSVSRLQALVAERRVLRLRYQAAGEGEATTRDVEPAGLVCHAGRWHLLAWCRRREAWRNFRADRVLAATALAERPPRRARGDLETLWRTLAWPREGTRVELEISERWAMEATRAHWGPAIVAERARTKGRLRVEFVCGDLDYAARWLAGLGAAARVLGPAELRERVADNARKVAALYARGARRRA